VLCFRPHTVQLQVAQRSHALLTTTLNPRAKGPQINLAGIRLLSKQIEAVLKTV